MTVSIRLIDKTGDPNVCSALVAMASCIEVQCNAEVKRAWNLDDVAVGVGNVAQAGEWPAYVVSKLGDPEALAYHDSESGYPGLFVGRDVILDNGGTILSGSNSISAALSHEVLEALIDPFCDFWSDVLPELAALATEGDPVGVALEIADPVEDGSYQVSDGKNIVSVSNFVLPEWFRSGTSREKFDHLGVLKAPQSLSQGGYVAFKSGEQVFGQAMAEWKREQKRRFGRRQRRVVSL